MEHINGALLKCEDKLDYTLRSLGSLKEDEIRAREQLDEIKVIIKTTLETRFKEMDIDSEAIRIFDIYKALSKIDGILDISDIKLNNGTSTIKLNDEIPILGTLTVVEETV